MFFKVAFLLLGFSVAAFAQLGPFCGCGALKSCLETKRMDLRRRHSECIDLCKNKLSGDANAAAGCIKQQREDLDAVKKSELKCLLEPSGGACLGGETTRRAKRQLVAQGQTNTNVQVLGGGLQVQSQTQTGAAVGAGASTGADVDSFIKPFHDCVRNCTKELEKATVVAGAQTADESVAKHLRGIEECSIKLGCSFNVASVNQAATGCRTNNSTELENRTKGIKLRYCNCVRDAIGKKPDEVNCQPSRG